MIIMWIKEKIRRFKEDRALKRNLRNLKREIPLRTKIFKS